MNRPSHQLRILTIVFRASSIFAGFVPDIWADEVKVVVPAPRTQVDVSDLLGTHDKPAASGSWEVGIGYFGGEIAGVPSHLRETSSFRQDQFPSAVINYLSPRDWEWFSGDVSFGAGLGFIPYRRAGKLDYAGAASVYSQSLYLIPLRFAVEWSPYVLQSAHFRAALSFAALPTLAMSTRAAGGDGGFGVGGFGEIAPSILYSWNPGFSLSLTVPLRAGRMSIVNRSLVSAGVQAGIRFSL